MSVRDPFPRRRDLEGCGCLRCRGIDPHLSGRGLVAGFVWNVRVIRRYPSILLVFLLPACIQLVTAVGPLAVAVAGALFNMIGLVVARGYLALVGVSVLTDRKLERAAALRTAIVRLPAVGGAVVVSGVVVLATVAVAVVLDLALTAAGVPTSEWQSTAVLAVFYLAAAAVVIKCCLVPEACFVGGYGPIEAVRTSWAITSFHRWKVVAATAGLVALLVVGFGGQTDGALLVTVSDDHTDLTVFAFGPGDDAGLRVLFNAVSSALYSGLFVHLYVQGVLAESAK